MAKQYEVTTGKRVVSWMMGQAARFGLGDFAVLTTTGRKSGEPRLVTVSPITHDGTEFVVSPYGDSGWVLNLRADPAATLKRGGSERQVTLVEVTGAQDGVVAAYHRREALTRASSWTCPTTRRRRTSPPHQPSSPCFGSMNVEYDACNSPVDA